MLVLIISLLRCGLITSIPAGAAHRYYCNGMVGRYVNVVLRGKSKCLQLCEVQVWTTDRHWKAHLKRITDEYISKSYDTLPYVSVIWIEKENSQILLNKQYSALFVCIVKCVFWIHCVPVYRESMLCVLDLNARDVLIWM